MNTQKCIQALKKVLPDHVVVTDIKLLICRDDRHQRTEKASAILYPRHVKDIQQIVRIAQDHDAVITCRGGNTGCVAGTLPSGQRSTLIIDLAFMNRILNINVRNRSVCCEAGITLASLNSALAAHDLYFPIELASETRCTIGGNIATNAGGLSAVHYGMTRHHVLGLETVLANADVLSDLSGLRKNNCGYALKHLFIGSEGTLGIITKAQLQCVPRPTHHYMIRLCYNTITDVLDDMAVWSTQFSQHLTACEIIHADCIELVKQYVPECQASLTLFPPSTWHLLLVFSYHHPRLNLPHLIEDILVSQQYPHAPYIAKEPSQQAKLWQVRKMIPLAETRHGLWIKNDIAVPLSHIDAFVTTTYTRLRQRYPHVPIVCFAHLGDGNLHYNVAMPTHEEHEGARTSIESLIDEEVRAHQGTIAAEHGIGLTKTQRLKHHLSTTHYQMMKTIKQCLDPDNRFNPDKIFDS